MSGCIESQHGEETSSSEESAPIQFSSVKTVLDNACTTCHSSTNSAALDMDNETDFISKGYIIPGKPEESLLIKRMTFFEDSNSNMPPDASTLKKEDYDLLYKWIKNMKPDSAVSTISKLSCSSEAEPSAQHMKRMTKKEYINTLNLLIGENVPTFRRIYDFSTHTTFKPFLDLLPEDSKDKDSYSSESKSITVEHVEAYYNISVALASRLTYNWSDNQQTEFYYIVDKLNGDVGSRCMLYTRAADIDCYKMAIKHFGKLAYRRPLKEEEVDSLVDLVTDLEDKKNNFQKIIITLLNSPYFLFKIENQGSDISSKPGYTKLTSYEVASRLSYTFWGSTPSIALYELADEDKLLTKAGIQEAFDHIFSDEVLTPPSDQRLLAITNKQHVKNKLGYFYDEYLGISSIPSLDTQKTRAFGNLASGENINLRGHAHRRDMINELNDIFDYYTWTQPADFSTVLTTKKYFARTADLAKLYGDEGRIWDPETDNKIEFAADERSGLLTRAGMLISGGHQTSPIHTGAKIYRKITCGILPSPPPLTEEDLIVEASGDISTREYTHLLTIKDKNNCATCHDRFNGYGYGLEKYDALGRQRVSRLEPIFDGNGDIVNHVGTRYDTLIRLGNTEFYAATPEQMFSALADSPLSNACYTKNLFEFVKGRKADVFHDGCELKKINDSLKNKGMLGAFKEFSSLESFMYRKN